MNKEDVIKFMGMATVYPAKDPSLAAERNFDYIKTVKTVIK